MTISVVAEICAAAWIKRPESLHAVGDRVAGRRAVGHRRWCPVITRTIIARGVGGGQCAADDCAPDNSSGNRRAPSPASTSPLHGLGNIRGGFAGCKWLADGRGIGGAGRAHQGCRPTRLTRHEFEVKSTWSFPSRLDTQWPRGMIAKPMMAVR